MILKSLHRSLLIAALAMPLLTTGCVSEGYQAYRYLTRTKVQYTDEHAFECTEVHLPSGRSFQPCAKCQNMSATDQHVTIGDKPYDVAPRAILMSCQDRAWVLE